MKSVKILVVDDHSLVRANLAEVLGRIEEFEIIGQAKDAKSAVEFVQRTPPDIVLMDIDMPGLVSFEAARRIAESHPDVGIIFLSAYTHDSYIEQALAVGAMGYFTKYDEVDSISDAIKRASQGECVYSSKVWERLVLTKKGLRLRDAGEPQKSRLSTLTAREVEILRYLAQGMSKKEISSILHIAVRTVEGHTRNLMDKLDIHERVELARFAIRENLVSA